MGDVVYTVDIIIPTENGVPLILRKYPPYQNHWACPGGIVDYEDYMKANKNLEEASRLAAIRETKEELSVDIEIIKKSGFYAELGRDPRGDYRSTAFIARIIGGQLRAADDAKKYKLFKEIPPNMAFDHWQILRDSKVFENHRRRDENEKVV